MKEHLHKKKHIRKASEQGQALVEFVILLTVMMALASGIVYIARLLDLQYWAQQEAKLLAFEQTWVPREASARGIVGADIDIDDLELRRPTSARNAGKERDLERNRNQDGMNDVIAKTTSHPAKTLPASSPALKQFEFVATAYASMQEQDASVRFGDPKDNFPNSQDAVAIAPKSTRGEKFTTVLSELEFGETFCNDMRALQNRYGRKLPGLADDGSCATQINRDFGDYIGDNWNIPRFFQDYNIALLDGHSKTDALEIIAKETVAELFYSFFDQRVATSYNGEDADNLIDERGNDLAPLPNDELYQRLEDDARYLGVQDALGSIEDAIENLSGRNSNEAVFRNETSGLALENALEEILFDDADEDYVAFIFSGFLFNLPDLFPIPDMTLLVGGLFDAIAHNVFSEETDLRDDIVSNPAVYVDVTYDPTDVTFSAAEDRFDTDNRTMLARSYILTQPWHIMRRDNEAGGNPFRQLGGQFDDKDDDSTEEAVLRRRVFGLNVLPTDVGDLIRPLSGIFPFLDTVADTIKPLDATIRIAKNFILDSPLNDVLTWIEDFSNGAVNLNAFKFPEWPAVRPQAYPGTIEIDGDWIAGEDRDFDDYLDEQDDNNPAPNPRFHDD